MWVWPAMSIMQRGTLLRRCHLLRAARAQLVAIVRSLSLPRASASALAACVFIAGVIVTSSGCAQPDFVIADAFGKDRQRSLASSVEGLLISQSTARFTTMEALAIAGDDVSAGAGSKALDQHIDDVRVALAIADRRVRSSKMRVDAAAGKYDSLEMQWRRELRAIDDDAGHQRGSARLEEIETRWDALAKAAEERDEACAAALKLVNERLIILRQARGVDAPPTAWPSARGVVVQTAVSTTSDALETASKALLDVLPKE